MSDNHSQITECVCSDMTIYDYSNIYETFNLFTVILALPIVSAFGVISNAINVFVFTRSNMRQSANTYLMALASSDLFVVVTGLFSFWLDSARSYLPSLKYAPYAIVCMLPIGYTAQTCSVYFTVAAAVDCYIKLCWSSVWTQYNTMRRSCQIVLFIAFGSCVYNSLRFGQLALHVCQPNALNGTLTNMVEICPTLLYFQINVVYNVYMYMALMACLPFLLLMLLNLFIVLRVGPNSNRVRSRQSQKSDDADNTITMIMVIAMFLSCNTLALIVNIVETFMEPSALVLNYMTDASNFLVIFNSSVNFVIYMIFSKEFRKNLKRLGPDEANDSEKCVSWSRSEDIDEPKDDNKRACDPPSATISQTIMKKTALPPTYCNHATELCECRCCPVDHS